MRLSRDQLERLTAELRETAAGIETETDAIGLDALHYPDGSLTVRLAVLLGVARRLPTAGPVDGESWPS